MLRKSALLVVILGFGPSLIQAQERIEDCVRKASAVHAGMTRAEIEAGRTHDGGISEIYKTERLYFAWLLPGERSGNESGPRKFCMLNIDFRPYGVLDATYNDASRFMQWFQATGRRSDPRDVVVKVSVPFLDYFHAD